MKIVWFLLYSSQCIILTFTHLHYMYTLYQADFINGLYDSILMLLDFMLNENDFTKFYPKQIYSDNE